MQIDRTVYEHNLFVKRMLLKDLQILNILWVTVCHLVSAFSFSYCCCVRNCLKSRINLFSSIQPCTQHSTHSYKPIMIALNERQNKGKCHHNLTSISRCRYKRNGRLTVPPATNIYLIFSSAIIIWFHVIHEGWAPRLHTYSSKIHCGAAAGEKAIDEKHFALPCWLFPIHTYSMCIRVCKITSLWECLFVIAHGFDFLCVCVRACDLLLFTHGMVTKIQSVNTNHNNSNKRVRFPTQTIQSWSPPWFSSN